MMSETVWKKATEQQPDNPRDVLVKCSDPAGPGATAIAVFDPRFKLWLFHPRFEGFKDVYAWCDIPEFDLGDVEYWERGMGGTP